MPAMHPLNPNATHPQVDPHLVVTFAEDILSRLVDLADDITTKVFDNDEDDIDPLDRDTLRSTCIVVKDMMDDLRAYASGRITPEALRAVLYS